MSKSATAHRALFLMFRCGAVRGALPLGEVRETLRPLPIAAMEFAPAFVLGVAIIRGLATPVVDGCRLLERGIADASSDPAARRFITLRVAERAVALAVDAVLGIRDVPAEAMAAVPPLLGATEHAPMQQLAQLDGDLWMLLRAGRLVPDLADVDSELGARQA